MSEIALRVENLGKAYRIAGPRRAVSYRTLQDELLSLPRRILSRSRAEIFWALRDCSFEVRAGEVVGIIGRNGAGKSTLLKILSRITEPTAGEALIYGRVGSLLEVGTGFHPELTGRENVYLSGAILGMRREEIARRFDEIVAFAEVEQFIETPVKHYSSGMYMRLAFAVAAHLEPEVLIVDEVLAVGDAAFQKKCLGKMSEVAKGGRTVLFVSHQMAAIENLCARCVYLDQGQVVRYDLTRPVIADYLAAQQVRTSEDLALRTDRSGSGEVRTSSVIIRDGRGEPASTIRMGEPFTVEVSYSGQLSNAVIGVIISNGWIEQLIRAYSYESVAQPIALEGGRFCCTFSHNYLMAGEYSITIWLGQVGRVVDHLTDCARLSIEPADVYDTGKSPSPSGGLFFTEHSWDIS